MQVKTALVTGASSGIGEEFARQLHHQGMNIILVARRAAKLEQICQDLNHVRSDSAQIFVCDLSTDDLQCLEKFVAENHIDILVSNAGRGSFGRFETIDRDAEEEMVRLNLIAPLRIMHAVIPQMKKRRAGAILSVASIAAFQPLPYMSTYAATKSFNLIHSQGLRFELAEFGIRVLAVCPGPTETEFAGVARVPGEWTGIYRDSVSQVVSESLRALEKNQGWITPCLRSKVLCLLSRITPIAISTALARRSLRGALAFVERHQGDRQEKRV